VRGADGTGIIVAGRRILVEGNNVSRSVALNSDDADGMRFFGSEITFRGNFIHDISDRGYPKSKDPHTDCFQTFDNDKPTTTNVLIEDNICDNVDHQCLIATALGKESAGIKFRNNICNNNGSQGVYIRNYRSVEVVNNLFLPSIKYFAVKAEQESATITIANNVFVGQFWPYDIDESSRAGLTADYNLADHPGQPTRPDWWKLPPEQHGIWTTDPKFIRTGDGKFDAYRPGPGSPLIDAGSDAYGASETDLVGNPRVVDGNADGTATIDIGPYEFIPAKD
jgi:parallel beta helix pectate lyase-like protein